MNAGKMARLNWTKMKIKFKIIYNLKKLYKIKHFLLLS
jgi:hypothetical protein